MPASFAALLATAARRRPGQPALLWDGGALSWRDLEQRAGGVARRLAQSGVQPGDVVALMLPNTWGFVAALWGGLALGATVAPLNPLLAGVSDLDEVERFVRAWLGELLDYDADREASDLVTTLGQYLDSGGSYADTCRALAVHRSTLKYRLQRIREISGHDLHSPEAKFNLALAVRAWRTLHAMRDIGPGDT